MGVLWGTRRLLGRAFTVSRNPKFRSLTSSPNKITIQSQRHTNKSFKRHLLGNQKGKRHMYPNVHCNHTLKFTGSASAIKWRTLGVDPSSHCNAIVERSKRVWIE